MRCFTAMLTKYRVSYLDLGSFNCPQVSRPEAESPMRYRMVVTLFQGGQFSSTLLEKLTRLTKRMS